MEVSLKDILEISKNDVYKFEEFKERIQHSLVAQNTLIGNDLSEIHLPEPPLILPLTPKVNEMLNDNFNTENNHHMTHLPSIIENILPNLLPPMTSNNHVQLNINQNRFEQDDLQK